MTHDHDNTEGIYQQERRRRYTVYQLSSDKHKMHLISGKWSGNRCRSIRFGIMDFAIILWDPA